LDLHELVAKLKELAIHLGRTPSQREFIASGVSGRQIGKHGHNEIVRAAGLEPNKSAHTSEPIEVEFKKPRILFIDIETAPIKSYHWGLFDQNISLNQVIDDWFIMSYSGKFNDEDSMYYLDQRYSKPVSDDRQLLEGVHDLISKADWICGHNVKKFDLKKINARFIKHGMAPLNHYRIIDTLTIARKLFAFTSNKLEFLAKYLECDHKKSEHKKFHGMALWTECLNGNMEAWEEMQQYNSMDVTVLIDVYNKLAPYDSSINFQSHVGHTLCSCGNTKFNKDGIKHNNQGKFQVYRCPSCGKTFQSKVNLLVKDLRDGFYK